MPSQQASHRAIALAVAAALGGLQFGCDSWAVNNPVDPIQSQFTLSHTLTGLTASALSAGFEFDVRSLIV